MTSAFKFLFIINFLKGNDLCNQNGYHRKEAVKKNDNHSKKIYLKSTSSQI
jgi:hypothetical protein